MTGRDSWSDAYSLDSRAERDRLEDLERLGGAFGADQAVGSAVMLGVTFTETTYPTSAGVAYAFNLQTLSGTESEGAAATYTPTNRTVHAFNVGTAIPPVGTKALIFTQGDRLCFTFDG